MSYLTIVLIIAPIGVVSCLVWSFRLFGEASWPKIPGVISDKQTQVNLYNRGSEVEKISNLVVVYTYKVNGVTYQSKENFGRLEYVKQSYEIGAPVDVYYDAGKPQESRLGNSNSLKLAFIALGASLVQAIGFFFGLHAKRLRDKLLENSSD